MSEKKMQSPDTVLSHARRLVARQEKDEGLFFKPISATEAYLQSAIKELHCVIKGDIFFKDIFQNDKHISSSQ